MTALLIGLIVLLFITIGAVVGLIWFIASLFDAFIKGFK